MRTMVLVYLPTKLGDFVRVNVGKYSSTMEHMEYVILFWGIPLLFADKSHLILIASVIHTHQLDCISSHRCSCCY